MFFGGAYPVVYFAALSAFGTNIWQGGTCFPTGHNKYSTSIKGKEQEIVVGQYAVRVPVRGTKRHQIVEVGGDLGDLMSKYNISEESVCILV